ncbi:MarR family winged helix-turn-helix transcriptional regulator [Streptomyces natalensis]|uniref:HTH marR-type domain-containing protein n=1 Tax=Streptomyces natalensis ATCC 27448 TaxID=1240678 RepID=A0A0D7CKK7_9ACTN|nr:MarR family transcriptional regulator [Streptomyces natalensis]KIZ16626.1 hypothetical protein SNA_16415 [Streptomyces natalensis ATCC 27448]
MSTEEPLERPPVLLHLPVFALAHFGRVARGAAKNAFAGQGLSSRAHFVLLCLDEYGELSQRELSDRIAMDRSDLVKLLDELERTGQVRRQPDPRDRRRHALVITAAGMETLKQGERILHQATDEVLARLSTEQRAELQRLVLQALGADQN